MGIRENKETYNRYMREYHLKRYHLLRQNAVETLGGKCVNCESENDLQIDHRRKNNKAFDVGKLINYSLDLFWKEIKKCQLLCRKCHRLKTTIESGKDIAKGNHGTLSSRRYCNCAECVKVKTDWMREYKRKEKAPL